MNPNLANLLQDSAENHPDRIGIRLDDIAIARIALMNPRILILDEATSSVDTRTERFTRWAHYWVRVGSPRTSVVVG